MKRYIGGEKVLPGIYFGGDNLEFVDITCDNHFLPGDESSHYVKVPAIAPYLFGPFMGLAFIFFATACTVFLPPVLLGVKAWRKITYHPKLNQRIIH